MMVLQFAPEVHVGDGLSMDLKLSNHVYNALKRHCHTEQRRSARLHEKKEHSTAVSSYTSTFSYTCSFTFALQIEPKCECPESKLISHPTSYKQTYFI